MTKRLIRKANGALAVLLLAVACSATAPTPGPANVQLATQSAPSSACDEALGGGLLVPDPRTGLGVADATGEVRGIVWPFSWSAVLVDDQIALLDDRGQVAAREGDRVEFGGGLGVQDFFYVCPAEIRVLGPGA